jgi:hypothetical protein
LKALPRLVGLKTDGFFKMGEVTGNFVFKQTLDSDQNIVSCCAFDGTVVNRQQILISENITSLGDLIKKVLYGLLPSNGSTAQSTVSQILDALMDECLDLFIYTW